MRKKKNELIHEIFAERRRKKKKKKKKRIDDKPKGRNSKTLILY